MGQGKPTALISAQHRQISAFRYPPPRLLVTRERNIAESRTLWEVHTLIYPGPK
jgi:hypothetical protein